jgi:hypothetical protein
MQLVKYGTGLPDFMAILKEIEDDRRKGADWIVPANKISVSAEDGSFQILKPSTGEIKYFSGKPTNFAENQLGNYLGIPPAYITKLKAELPLKAYNFNYWLGKAEEKKLVRTITNPQTKEKEIIAFLSDRYRPIDNYDVMEKVLYVLSEMKINVAMHHVYVTDQRLSGIFYDTSQTYHLPGDDKDVYMPGIQITNSEVGSSAFVVRMSLVRQVCTNGMVYGPDYRRIHIGHRSEDSDIWSNQTKIAEVNLTLSQVTDIVKRAFDKDMIDDVLFQLSETKKKVIKPTWVDLTAKEFHLTDAENSTIWAKIESNNRYEYIQAVTSHANDLLIKGTDPDRATILQELAWELINDAPWKRVERKDEER